MLICVIAYKNLASQTYEITFSKFNYSVVYLAAVRLFSSVFCWIYFFNYFGYLIFDGKKVHLLMIEKKTFYSGFLFASTNLSASFICLGGNIFTFPRHFCDRNKTLFQFFISFISVNIVPRIRNFATVRNLIKKEFECKCLWLSKIYLYYSENILQYIVM